MMVMTPSNRDMAAPADNTKTLPFECTYPNCIMRFGTLKEMKYHKLNGADHYYCKKCDVDCDDWDELTQHKVTAMSPWVDGPMRGNREVLPKHIVCEFCGIEYKTFGARRMHREQCHPAEQSITCPMDECKIIFVKAAEFIRHLENGECEGVSATEFRMYLEQNHVNKQIMKDTTISERLQENKAAAAIRYGSSTEDTDTDFGGVALSGTPSIMDTDDERLQGIYQPLEPEQDLISMSDPSSPTLDSESVQWPSLSSPLTKSMRTMSISSHVPSENGTELSASEYATRISKIGLSSATSRGGNISTCTYTESYPSISSPSYAPSMTSETASDVTASRGGSRASSVWATGATSRALFPDAKSTPASEYGDEDAVLLTRKDLRQVRWWDPDHAEFEPDFFRNKDLMETKGFGCPFADCEDNYGYDTLDVLKEHIRRAHLDIDHRCPCCHKKFKKPSALMAHTESNGKCKVQGSAYFKQLIADISGGFLKAKRLQIPKIFRQEKPVVLANGVPINGIMQTEYKAKMPHKK